MKLYSDNHKTTCKQITLQSKMTKTLELTPKSSLKLSSHQIPAHNLIPNTSIQSHPLLVYHSCFPSSATPSNIESHLKSIGVIVPQWRYSMYQTTHFHSTTHEVLVISKGAATLLFGGEENPEKVEVKVEKGDAIIVPAGVGHRLLEGDLEMVGSYPKEAKQWNVSQILELTFFQARLEH